MFHVVDYFIFDKFFFIFGGVVKIMKVMHESQGYLRKRIMFEGTV